MDIAEILRNILIVLVAAKVAAEIAERIGIPAVVGEIVAGILIGPSMLGLVEGGDEVLRTLGEIGVILLLLDVGLEMDLGELGKVGRTSLLVAAVGVVAADGSRARRHVGDGGGRSTPPCSSAPRSPPPASASPPASSATSERWPPTRPASCSARRSPTT